jgi:uncharacterized protein
MPVILAFLALLLGCLLISSLLLPWLAPLFASAIGLTPDRTLYRFAMLLGLIGLPWMLRRLKLNGREAMGFRREPHGTAHALMNGMLIGMLILIGLIGGQIASGARVVVLGHSSHQIWDIVRVALSGAVGGLLVGLIEEFFFRGPMHTGARRSLGFWPVALLTGLFYSLVHFIRPLPFGDAPVDIANALHSMFGGLAQLDRLDQHFDRFVALWIAGIFLSMVRERTGNILWAIGIHAGWVAIIKLGKLLTDADPHATTAYLISSDGVTGWLSSIWMGAIALIYWRISATRSPRSRVESGNPSRPGD